MNRRTFFGALVGGTVSSRIAVGNVSPNCATPNRFTKATKFGDYYFYWTGWKKTINQVVNVGQWMAEPAEGLDPGPHATQETSLGRIIAPMQYVRGRPAFYSSTSGTNGPISNMHFIMDLSYQEGFPLITDKSSTEEKREAKEEALERLIKYIEAWEQPEFKYVGNGTISNRNKLRPGDLIDMGGASLHKEGLTWRALRKVTHE